jgi:capsular exopolysaccharide synthesis family protein
MEPKEKQNQTGYGRGGYGSGYGYGAYGGYGYGGYGANDTVAQRTLQDYLLIIRERVWYIVVVFLVVFGSVLVYSFSQTPIHQSTATVEVFRRNPMVMQVQQVMDSEVRSAEDLNTQVNILKSATIVQRVAARLTGEDLRQFLVPYIKPGQPAPTTTAILFKNRDIVPQRLSLIIDVNYRHPDSAVAAKIANLFADEYIAYNAHILVDESLKAVEELEQRADEQRKKVDDIAGALQNYREKNKLVSLDQRKDIVTEKLRELNGYVTQNSAVLQAAETRRKQVLACRQRGDDLLNLQFIATVPAVSQLQQQVASLKIAIAQLSERYRPKHPQMIQAVDSLKEAEQQLKQAIDTSTAQVEAEYQTALQNYSQAQAALARQESDSLTLDRYGLEYTNLERDYDVNQKLLEHILERMRETSMTNSVENQNARIVDRAAPVAAPVSPNYKLNFSLGFFGGLVLGLGAAFFAAYNDDRVKSALDIEAVVGLPLIGIIPEINRMGNPDEMSKTIATKDGGDVSEAFSTLLSSLQLKEQSKAAQCIIVTSTVAGEGKSFISANLAQTYATHGSRAIILDCDLRRPAINRIFHIENLKGVIDVCTADAKLDDVIVKGVRSNMDVLVTGGRSKNPTQMLNGKAFAVMLSELRKRYDKIIIDTPPVAIVSDALILLPLVDGWLYSLFFNKVRRKTAQFSAQRMLETNIPCFGAILNGLSGGLGGYYYSHYYHKSYNKYYVTKSEVTDGSGPKIVDLEKNGQHSNKRR